MILLLILDDLPVGLSLPDIKIKGVKKDVFTGQSTTWSGHVFQWDFYTRVGVENRPSGKNIDINCKYVAFLVSQLFKLLVSSISQTWEMHQCRLSVAWWQITTYMFSMDWHWSLSVIFIGFLGIVIISHGLTVDIVQLYSMCCCCCL